MFRVLAGTFSAISAACDKHPALQMEGIMKLSARNILKGTVVNVVKGQTTAHVTIDVKGIVVTAAVTNEAVDELKLEKGMKAAAVIKASDVIVAVD